MKVMIIAAALIAATSAHAEFKYKVIVDDTLTASRAVTLAIKSTQDKEETTLQLGINSQRSKAYTLECVLPYKEHSLGALVLTSYDLRGDGILLSSQKVLAVEPASGEPCTPSYKRMNKPSASAIYQLKAVVSVTEEAPSDLKVGNFIFFERK